MTAPIWTAKAAYEACDPPYSWGEVLNAHLGQGYCVSTTEYFICARPVCVGAPECELLDPNFEFPVQQCDAWMVYIAAGAALPSLWTVQPLDLPWVMFYRLQSNRLRVYSNQRLQEISQWEKENQAHHQAHHQSLHR